MNAVSRVGNRNSSAWLGTRLDPSSSVGGVLKPDGMGAGRSIAVNHMVADVITCTSTAGFTIQTLPGNVPFTAIAIGNGGTDATDIKINGVQLTNSDQTLLAAQTPSSWAPLGVLTEWAATPAIMQTWTASSTPKNDPYRSTQARVLSVQRRLMYTGTLTSNAGFINVSPSPFDVTKFPGYVGATSPTANLLSLQALDSSNSNTTQYSVGTAMYSIDISSPTTPVFNRDTVDFRVEQGANIISKQSGELHAFQPVPDMGFMLVANQSMIASGTAANNNYRPLNCDLISGAGPLPMASWFLDSSWEGELINVTGITNGATFRLETYVVLEYQLAAVSPFAPLAINPPPPDKNAVERAQKMANALPVAVPGSRAGGRPGFS
jgi:hypothetical protein